MCIQDFGIQKLWVSTRGSPASTDEAAGRIRLVIMNFILNFNSCLVPLASAPLLKRFAIVLLTENLSLAQWRPVINARQ